MQAEYVRPRTILSDHLNRTWLYSNQETLISNVNEQLKSLVGLILIGLTPGAPVNAGILSNERLSGAIDAFTKGQLSKPP